MSYLAHETTVLWIGEFAEALYIALEIHDAKIWFALVCRVKIKKWRTTSSFHWTLNPHSMAGYLVEAIGYVLQY